MTIYNFNLGIGWASSGVEYAQLYRSQIFRKINQSAKFIFLDFIGADNIQHLTENIGFYDEDVIWIYQYFTDMPIEPTTYAAQQLESTFDMPYSRIEDQDTYRRYFFDDNDRIVTAYKAKKNHNAIERVEFVAGGKLIRKDFFTSKRLFSEYYAPHDNRAYLYERHFFNRDGSLAYEEIVDGDQDLFRINDQLIYGKSELVAYFIKCLKLQEDDMVIVDRATGVGQAIFENVVPAKLAVAIHAEHFNPVHTNDHHILWNNFYEYQFDEAQHVDLFITATQKQKNVLEGHFRKYTSFQPKIESIPVGNLEHLIYPEKPRGNHTLITASRLAAEKHVDWLVKAVVVARQEIPDIKFDIYGSGGEKNKIEKIIQDNSAEKYIVLRGHAKLDNIYKQYSAYVSASTSEGFGLTLMEAVGSGLSLVGFDVPYGNQTFISEGENGYLVPYHSEEPEQKIINELSERIVKLFINDENTKFHAESYLRASKYLVSEVSLLWDRVIKEVIND